MPDVQLHDGRDGGDRPDVCKCQSVSGVAFDAQSDCNGSGTLKTRQFVRRFDLPREAWVPGAPAPFDADLRRAIGAMAGARSQPQRAEWIARMLAGERGIGGDAPGR